MDASQSHRIFYYVMENGFLNSVFHEMNGTCYVTCIEEETCNVFCKQVNIFFFGVGCMIWNDFWSSFLSRTWNGYENMICSSFGFFSAYIFYHGKEIEPYPCYLTVKN